MERCYVLCIAGHIAFKLWLPVFLSRTRQTTIPAFDMLMPKAPVYEDHFAKLSYDDVGLSRQTSYVKSISEAESINYAADDQLRGSVFGTDVPHMIRPLLRSQTISRHETHLEPEIGFAPL
jgi:hypothetical protein